MGLWSTDRDPKRIKSICQLLENAWSRYPDQRLGQFLLNFVFGSLGRDTHIYCLEDDDIETSLKRFILNKSKKNEEKSLLCLSFKI